MKMGMSLDWKSSFV